VRTAKGNAFTEYWHYTYAREMCLRQTMNTVAVYTKRMNRANCTPHAKADSSKQNVSGALAMQRTKKNYKTRATCGDTSRRTCVYVVRLMTRAIGGLRRALQYHNCTAKKRSNVVRSASGVSRLTLAEHQLLHRFRLFFRSGELFKGYYSDGYSLNVNSSRDISTICSE